MKDLHDAHRELSKWLNEEQTKPIDRVALATVLVAVAAPEATGWSDGLSQDYNGKLGAWFADRPGAMRQVREQFAPSTQPSGARAALIRQLRDVLGKSVHVDIANEAANMLAADAQDWSRFHHLMKKHGLHPGRTDDNLMEILDAKLSELAQQVVVPQGWQSVPVAITDDVRNVLVDRFDRSSKGACLLFADIWADLLAAAPQAQPAVEAELTDSEILALAHRKVTP
jgi:hypothetical protein